MAGVRITVNLGEGAGEIVRSAADKYGRQPVAREIDRRGAAVPYFDPVLGGGILILELAAARREIRRCSFLPPEF